MCDLTTSLIYTHINEHSGLFVMRLPLTRSVHLLQLTTNVCLSLVEILSCIVDEYYDWER